MNPQDFSELPIRPKAKDPGAQLTEEGATAAAVDHIQIDRLKLSRPSTLMPEPHASLDVLSFNFDNIDTQRAIDSYSIKSSVKNSSSGILEVLQDLEAEEERENERKQQQLKPSSTTTQSHQDLSTFKPKEESKRFQLRSFLKRTHSAPKKIQVTKTCPDELDEREKSPPQAQCCHPIVEKLKTMADKQLHKKAPKKPSKSTIKTVPLSKEKRIVLAEQTRIIRLKDSPKAERKNVAAYLEKRDSDDTVEIFQLDESPSETRKRREDSRKLDEQEEHEEHERNIENKNAKQKQYEEEKGFVVPQNLTGLDTEPTVEELLEEEFKNDPPKKAPRKTKEHIYEEIEAPGAIATHTARKLGKPANMFASAVLHSVLNKDEFKENLIRQNEIEDAEELKLEEDQAAPAGIVVAKVDLKHESDNGPKPIPEEVIDLKPSENEPAGTQESSSVPVETTPKMDSTTNIEITIENTDGEVEEKSTDETDDCGTRLSSDTRKDVLSKDEKKVKFSQSTEERYQEKLAAEKGPDKEDVELPEHIQVSKRWSNMK